MAAQQKTPDELYRHAIICALNTGVVKEGDLAVLTGGSEVNKAGFSNTMRIEYLYY
jgi:pyruvate kinase